MQKIKQNQGVISILKNTVLRKAFIDSLPIMIGYIFTGMAFGILLQSKGYNFLWAVLMSLTIYAGSMQYIAIDLLTKSAHLVTVALLTLAINARHFFYGLSMLDRFKGLGKAKPYLIFSLTDETYSVLCMDKLPEGMNKKHYYLAVSLFNQSYWILGSLIGGLLGSVIPFNIKGIDFAVIALLVVIFVEQWLSTKNHLAAIIGVATSIISLIIFGPGNFIIPALLIICTILIIFRNKLGGIDND